MKKIVSVFLGVLMCATAIYSVAGTPTLNADADRIRSTLSQPTGNNVSWDNGLPDGRNGVSIGGWPGYTREVIDDIYFSDTQFITSGSFRVVTYSGAGPGQITDVAINVYPDSSGTPGTTIYATKTASFTATLTGSTYFSRPEILYTCSFDAIVLPPGTWWVGFYPTSVENIYWLTSTKAGTSEIYLAYPDEGHDKWTAGHLVFDSNYYDVSFTLTGEPAYDTTPPVTTCVLIGDMNNSIYVNDVTVVLSATDFFTGVNYTKYKLDNGGWNLYTTSFIVTANGEHTLYFYSVDKVGNFEEIKNMTFTIEHEISCEITVKGGLGVSAVIKNVGTKNLTGLHWNIGLRGGHIFFGKQKSGTVDIAPGAEITVKDFVFGFGETIITTTAGDFEKTATGVVFLFFVRGVT